MRERGTKRKNKAKRKQKVADHEGPGSPSLGLECVKLIGKETSPILAKPSSSPKGLDSVAPIIVK